MSFKLTGIFTIGAYQFYGGVHECEIKRSVKEIVDTATITIPALGRINGDLAETASSIVTSSLFNEGDAVTIQLGYNYNYIQEFAGFVRRVTASIPVKIECEGYAWQLRRQRLVGNYPGITLKNFLTQLVKGTNIQLSQYIPDLPLVNLKIDQPDGLKVLEHLKNECHLSVYFLFNTLYVGLEAGVPNSTGVPPSTLPPPQFQLGYNTIRDDKLKWRNAGDDPTMVRLVSAKGKNTKRPMVTYGDANGSVATKNIANVTDPTWANAIAKDVYNQAVYTGFEGSFTAFLQPYIQMCDSAPVSDNLYNVRTGTYFTQGTHVKFGVSGASREVFIGQSLSGSGSSS